MSTPYNQRAASAGKYNLEYLEKFNIKNVVFMEDTGSPRLRNSHNENLRKLTEAQKNVYAGDLKRLREELSKDNVQQKKQKSGREIGEYLLGQRTQNIRTAKQSGHNFKNLKEEITKKGQPNDYRYLNDYLNEPKKQTVISVKQEKPVENTSPIYPHSESIDDLVNKVIETDKQELQGDSPTQRRFVQMERRLEKKIDGMQLQMREINLKNGILLQKIWEKVNKGTKQQNGSSETKQLKERSKIHLSTQYDLQKAKRQLQHEREKQAIILQEIQAKLKDSQKRNRQLEQIIKSKDKAKDIQIFKSDTTKPNNEKQKQATPFHSQLVATYNISSFLKESIQNFVKKALKRAKLIYQKDQWNTNISPYLQKPPFNTLILMRSSRGCIFGAFTEGIQTYVTSKLKEEKIYRFYRAFLFNATSKKIFGREERGEQGKCKLSGVSYHDNYLRFGNNEVSLKNNCLWQINVAGHIFGDKYFSVQKRQQLTGEEGEVVELADLEIFELFIE